ncbi:hypothetical protein BT93_C1644 [Corymbia citriodora subsp. variegata]|nr:hypothetical protein BT93_C1644 [Corymbia citriodora subsp. variegata]
MEGFDLKTNSPEEVVRKVIAEVLKAKELYEKY